MTADTIRKVGGVRGVTEFTISGNGACWIADPWLDLWRSRGEARMAEHFEQEFRCLGGEPFEGLMKSTRADRYTLAPLYAPNRRDAHGDFVEDDVLQKATRRYVRESALEGRPIMLQHGDRGDIAAGHWVEAWIWPEEHTIKMRDGLVERSIKMPANTVYMGVVWDESYWKDGAPFDPIAKRSLRGLSLAGRAQKVRGVAGPLLPMGFRKARHNVRDEKGRFTTVEPGTGFRWVHSGRVHPALRSAN